MINLKHAEKFLIFSLKRFNRVMLFLIFYISLHIIQRRLTVRKCAKTMLPLKFGANITFYSNKFSARFFDFSYQIRYTTGRLHDK